MEVCYLRERVAEMRSCYLVMIGAAPLALSACAHQPPPSADAPGFFHGVWDGFTIVFSLIASIFTDCRIYEFPNAGRLYDLGFVIGAALFLVSVGNEVAHQEIANRGRITSDT